MGGVSIWHWLVVGMIVLLLFGRGKISDMMSDVAKGIKAFKKGMADDDTATATTTTTAPGEPALTIEHQSIPPSQPATATTGGVTTPMGASTSGTMGERKVG